VWTFAAAAQQGLIAAVNEYHRAHIIRYEFATTRIVPTCATLFPIVEAILAACK
jgi:hypothetical protein